eukprot:scaffold145673_cov19-Tisochrysis_lutea.AAC.1
MLHCCWNTCACCASATEHPYGHTAALLTVTPQGARCCSARCSILRGCTTAAGSPYGTHCCTAKWDASRGTLLQC